MTPPPQEHPVEDGWTQGEVVRTLGRIELSVKGLEVRLDGLTAGFVPRAEWIIWAEGRDREIADLKSARAPWWTWAIVVLSVVTLLIALIPKLAI